MADDQTKPPVAKSAPQADDGIDTIPVNKTPVGLIVGIVVGVLLVAGTLVWTMGGGKSKKSETDAATAPAQEEGPSKEELKQRREHMKMTQRALAKAEAAEQAKEAEEEADEGEADDAPVAKKGGGSAPAPAPVNPEAAKKTASELDSVLGDTLSGLEE